MRILLTGGGTGGHVTPLLAIAKSLRDREKKVKLFWLGQGNPEESAAREIEIPFCKIACAKFRRYFSFWNFVDIFKIPIGIFQSFFLILGFGPDVVFSKGGYVSLPVVLAAFLLRKKIIVHESDGVTGLSNRIAARLAKKVLLGFNPRAFLCGDYFGRPLRADSLAMTDKYIFTGNPVRKEILQGNREKAFQFFHLNEISASSVIPAKAGIQKTGAINLDPRFRGDDRKINFGRANAKVLLKRNKPVILAMGGSQGSRFINELIIKALPKLKNYQIIHLSGNQKVSPMVPPQADCGAKTQVCNMVPHPLRGLWNQHSGNYYFYSFLDSKKMALAYSVCDLIISRAGANTLAEIAACSKPSILIPLPTSASGHQLANAKVFEKAGASIILEQKDLDADKLVREIENLFADPVKIEKMKARAKSLAKMDAGERIAEEILGK